jgi:hypothetical protein
MKFILCFLIFFCLLQNRILAQEDLNLENLLQKELIIPNEPKKLTMILIGFARENNIQMVDRQQNGVDQEFHIIKCKSPISIKEIALIISKQFANGKLQIVDNENQIVIDCVNLTNISVVGSVPAE